MPDIRHRLAMYLHMRGIHVLCIKWRPDVTGFDPRFVYAEIHR